VTNEKKDMRMLAEITTVLVGVSPGLPTTTVNSPVSTTLLG
jgi:hypothetical protein